jgi:hypothetical protein
MNSLQEILGDPKNIFLLVSAEPLFQAAGSGEPVNVEDYCALQDSAGSPKFGPETKDKSLPSSLSSGEEVSWIGKVDPASRNSYSISILQIVVREMENQNIFNSTYLPGTNKKVVADVLADVPSGTKIRYDIWFSLMEKETGDTKVFILDPWLIVK